MKLNPKERFLTDPARAGRLLDVVKNPEIQFALESALLHYIMGLTTNSLQSAAETAYKMEGARGFVDALLNLGDKTQPLKERPDDRLRPV